MLTIDNDDVESSIIIARGAAPFTARELSDMTESRAWKRFTARIDLMIEDARKTCETAADPDVWRKAQGAAEALRRVKQIPGILESEMST